MRTLIIQLPPDAPSSALAYVHALVQAEFNDNTVQQQSAVASLLPTADRRTEHVALLPGQAVSWHRVDLPAGLNKPTARLQAALRGLLEDRLLDDPEQLHMALQPGWQNTSRPWVAVCDRTWLSAHLQALEQAGLPIHRIVPEFYPPLASSDACEVTALGNTETGWLWVSHPERGVWGLPIHALHSPGVDIGLSADELANARLQAAPGVVAWATETLGPSVRLMPPGQHWLAASRAAWDLAQFGLRANHRTRHLKNWQRGFSHLRHSPDWRPARWGLGLLLASQLIGWNAWAWKTRANWQAQQASWAQVLRETFPNSQVVVDAPLQMAREVELLRQASGQLSDSDLEAMLAALGDALPAGLAAPTQLSYQPGELRVLGFSPTAAQQTALQQAMTARGYGWRLEGDAWIIAVKSTPPNRESEQ
jgi:general secretion pathway protein L